MGNNCSPGSACFESCNSEQCLGPEPMDLQVKTMDFNRQREDMFIENNLISEAQFLEDASLGDVILLQTNNSDCKRLRALTWSEYDHIALVLKYGGDTNIYLYEAVGDIGVRINTWQMLRQQVGPGKFYSHVTYRHVNFDRNPRVARDFAEFMESTLGLKYELTAAKILRRKSPERVSHKEKTPRKKEKDFERERG